MKASLLQRRFALNRREFLAMAAGAVGTSVLVGCSSGLGSSTQAEPSSLPPSTPDPNNQFGVDIAINMTSIDNYLNRPDVVYRDVRMAKDPAKYENIGGNSNLDMTLEGFKIVPWPYIGTLQELPVEGAYTGDTLFTVAWDNNGEVISAEPNFKLSHQILEELFPKDNTIFLMCGGGGYAGMTRTFLIHQGWDPKKLYNVGGAWEYTGYKSVQLIAENAEGETEYYTWRADIANIDFSTLIKR